jgi:hypothetical protein
MTKLDTQTILIGAGVLVVGLVVWKASSSVKSLATDTSVALGGAVNAINPFSSGSLPRQAITGAQNVTRSFYDTLLDWLPGDLSNKKKLDAAGTQLIAPVTLFSNRSSTPLLSLPSSANSGSPMMVNNTIPLWNDFSSFKLL